MPDRVEMWIKKMFFTYLSLEDAAKISYEIMNFSDNDLVHMPAIEEKDVLSEMFAKRDGDLLYLQKKEVRSLDFRTRHTIDFLGQYIKDARLSLYGEKSPATTRVKIPLKDIKNWSRDFNMIYKDDSFSKVFGERGTPIIAYQNIRVKRKELKNLLQSIK
jgi:hypothetical protein